MIEAMKRAKSVISRRVLPNGLVVIAESMPHVRSVSLGIWLHAGSRRESPALNGIAHFIEHMVFKGTSRRTAEMIAREMDSVGGLLDAFTAKETVSFNAKVLDEHLPIAFDVLSDLVLRPLFAEEDLTKEKQVVLEEIKMEEDNPESLAHEVLTQDFWRGHPLGSPILGTSNTVRHFTRDAVVDCFRHWYAPNNIVVTAAGHITMPRLIELVRGAFGALKPRKRLARESANHKARPPQPHARLVARDKPALEQAHITMAVPSYPLADPRRYATSLLNNILGGGMSSRLFQNIRERQGLAYAVFSELNPYSDAGMLSIYAGTGRSTIERVLRSVAEEFRRMKREPVAEDELRRAKDHLKGSLLLSLESSGARMSNLARQEMYFGRFFTIKELQASIEAVTREDVQRIAQEFFQPEKIAVTVLGPLKGFRLTRDLLAC
ncbi:MAG TPA: pitrilysin family protein [Candidatus Acidoferrales bacterium]